jgi:hypothetical protein
MNDKDRDRIVRWKDVRTGREGWSDPPLTEYAAHGYSKILEALGHTVWIERVAKKR